MQLGQGTSGMQTLNQCLAGLYLKREVTLEDAIGASSDPNELQQIIASGGGKAGAAPSRPAGPRG
jgi:twitching motility protein PilT